MLPKEKRLQGAMEYLMTYGWAILVIAVVLGVLYQLGVFNPATFSPKATSGSCSVFKNVNQYGIQASLKGICSGLPPQFVGRFSGSGFAQVPANSLVTGNTFTLSMWLNMGTFQTSCRSIIGKTNSAGWLLYMNQGCVSGPVSASKIAYKYVDSVGVTHDALGTANTFPTGAWINYLLSVNSTTITSYVNGKADRQITAQNTPALNTNLFYIGNGDSAFNGSIADVQLYNISLTSSQAQGLYLGGIGGPPEQLQNLIGWWPLNGDTKDYSGNNNNAAPMNGMSYYTTWSAGYTPP